jgi:hypothetical protein
VLYIASCNYYYFVPWLGAVAMKNQKTLIFQHLSLGAVAMSPWCSRGENLVQWR